MPRPDHHNEIQLNLLSRGRITYLLGAQQVHVQVGRLTAFWAAIPHQIIDYEDETEYFVATLPLAWVLQSRLSDNLIQTLMRGEVVSEPSAQRTEIDTMLFKGWEDDLASDSAAIHEVVTKEMETRLRRLALAVESTPAARDVRKPASLQAGGLTKVERMLCFIAQNYLEQITAADICKVVDLHPNFAMKIFKKAFGATLVEHLTHHRVFHAKRLLATTDLKIVDVAFGSGFGSISRFNEAFLRTVGCTPREYRSQYTVNG